MDRIIVETFDDMSRIIDWCNVFLKDEKWYEMGDKRHCIANDIEIPFERAEVWFKEEGLMLETIATPGSKIIHMRAYVDGSKNGKISDYTPEEIETATKRGILKGDKMKFCTFDWDTETGKVINEHTPYDTGRYDGDRERSVKLHTAMAIDNTLVKLGRKYNALIIFASEYRPEIEARKRIVAETKSKQKKQKKQKKGKGKATTKTLYVREYVMSKDFTGNIPRHYKNRRKPDHEFDVRGFYRHYKSGKTVWIKPSTRCKGRGAKQDRTYLAKVGT